MTGSSRACRSRSLALPLVLCGAGGASAQTPTPPKAPDEILLKDFRPVSLHKVPVTTVAKARYPVIDMHAHSRYAKTPEEVDLWVEAMDAVGIQKSVLLTGAYGRSSTASPSSPLDTPAVSSSGTASTTRATTSPGFGEAAVAELDRCVAGSEGRGRGGDKGLGMGFGKAKGLTSTTHGSLRSSTLRRARGTRRIHVADPIWMYQAMDATTDGMMNAVSRGSTTSPDSSITPG